MNIDVIIPLFHTYDLVERQLERWRNISGNWRLLICDNTPSNAKRPIRVPKDIRERVVLLSLENFGIDGEKHGGVLDFMVNFSKTDVIAIQDCDFFWIDNDILKHVERFFSNGYVCVGAELHYNAFDYVNDMYPERRGCFIPCVFGMFIKRELALSETFVVTAHEGWNQKRETGWRIRDKIRRENLKCYVFPAIQHPLQSSSSVKNIDLPWFYVSDHKFSGFHMVGSTSYNSSNRIELLDELYRISGLTIPEVPPDFTFLYEHDPNKKILILGGCGYIGTALSEHLQKSFDITVVDTLEYGNYLSDIKVIRKDYSELEPSFLQGFHTIILCSAHSSVRLCTENPFVSSVNNLFKFINFINTLEKLSTPPVFIYMSSSSVYGDCKDQNVNETFDISKPYNMYDLGKYVIDQFILRTNLNFYGLRLGTVNGFSKNLREELMINAMVTTAKKTGHVNIFNKEINRPILWIHDLCRAVETIIRDPSHPGIYNLCSFNSTVEQIGLAVSGILKVGMIEQEPDTHNEKMKTKNYNFTINSEKFEKTFNFRFEGTLENIVLELDKNTPENSDSRPKRVCRERIDCIVCGKRVELLLDLGEQPLANNYHKGFPQDMYPLRLMLCKECDHLQLSHNISPELLFKNYQYRSGTSITLRKYFSWLAQKIKTENPSASSILELACNDGSQLDCFKKLGWRTGGVDPAENIVKNITEHKIYNLFFSQRTSSEIEEKYDVILAQNVVAHTDTPHSFLKGCRNIMGENTVLYIQTSQCDMVRNNEFDTIYHEHVSFFSIRSMEKLLRLNGLFLQNVEKTNIHGNSMLYTVRKVETGFVPPSFTYDYEIYKEKVENIVKKLSEKISAFKECGYKVIGYGASAKGNTLLNWGKIKLDYILDDQKSKHGLLTPGMNIEIKEPEYIQQEEGKVLVVALAWNFLAEISNRIRYLTKNTALEVEILQYFPEIKIEPLYKLHNLTLISHFYNEEYLLPYWLEHHRSIFEYGIMINYGSTDKSVDIIRKMVPHWKIVDSRNSEFDALLCDEEVKYYETTIQYGYKIALNITEFIQKNIRDVIRDNFHECIMLHVVTALDTLENFGKDLDPNIPLPLQRYMGNFDHNCRSQRYIHRKPCLDYDFGRHVLLKTTPVPLPKNEVCIIYYGYAPANDRMIERMIQKNPRYSKNDVDNKTATIRDYEFTRREMLESYSKTPLDDLREKTRFFSLLESEWKLSL